MNILMSMYLIDRITFCFNDKFIALNEQRVALDKQTCDILLLLIKTKQPVSKELLQQQIWQGRHVSDAAITSAIRRIRKAISQLDDTVEYIKTISKVGYQLSVSVEDIPSKGLPVNRRIKNKYPFFVAIPIILILVVFLWFLITWNTETTKQSLPATYRQAIHLIGQKDPKFSPKAIELLNETIQHNPNLVEAHHALAQIYAYKMSRHLNISDQQIIEKAQYHILHAQRLAPEHTQTYLSQAMLDFYYLRNLDQVKQFFINVEHGLSCKYQCQLFLAYTAPMIGKAKLGTTFAENAYQEKPDMVLNVWQRAWSEFMYGDFVKTLTHINEAEQFRGRTSYLFRAMLAQAQNQNDSAMEYWILYFNSNGKLSHSLKDHYLDTLKQGNHQVVAEQLLEQLQSLPIDQEVELLLLADKKPLAIEKILATTSLQEQTYLIDMSVSPLFTSAFTAEEIARLYRHLWPAP